MERAPRVALVTCAALPNIYEDERELVPMLAARGVEARAAVWDDPSVAWGAFDAIVIRSTWDYFKKKSEWDAWLARVEGVTRVANAASLVRWNADKRYLRDLEARGVAIVPTVFCEPGARASLASIVAEKGWSRAVVKPAVSGGAFRTHRFDAQGAAAHEADLAAILATGAALVQPYLEEIERDGEHSLLFFDGDFRFAVRKVPARGDYRVQPEFGGVFERVVPEPWLVERARAVIAACAECVCPPLYARIDGVRRDRDFWLMEAELIEPYLYLPARRTKPPRSCGPSSGSRVRAPRSPARAVRSALERARTRVSSPRVSDEDVEALRLEIARLRAEGAALRARAERAEAESRREPRSLRGDGREPPLRILGARRERRLLRAERNGARQLGQPPREAPRGSGPPPRDARDLARQQSPRARRRGRAR